MNLFQKTPIRRKQTLVIMATTSVALLLVCAALTVFEVITFRIQMKNELSSYASIVGNNVGAALDFNDPNAAQDTLSALKAEPGIIHACVYTPDGAAFAQYNRSKSAFTPPPLQKRGYKFGHGTLSLFQPIESGSQFVGVIYLESDTAALRTELARYAAISLTAFVVTFFISLLLSSRLQRLISEPILRLARAAHEVARNKDYSVRIPGNRNADEIGALVESFNEMLGQIQERDARLEQRVQARTQELNQSLSILNASLDSTADGILIVSPQGKKIVQNRKVAELWKIPRQVADDKDDNVQVQFVVNAMADPGEFSKSVGDYYSHPDKQGRDEIQLKDGTIMERVTGPVLGEDGTNYGRIWTFRDITKRKEAEEALRVSEEKFRRLFDSSQDAFMTLSPPDWRFVSCNPSTLALFRAKDEAEFTSKTPWELSPERQPDGLLSAEKAKAMIEQAMREGNHYFEWTHKRLDGKEFPATVLLTRLELKGRTLLNACVRDITERREAELVATAFSKLAWNLNSAASRHDAARIIGDVANDLFRWDAFWVQLYSEKERMVYPLYNVDMIDGRRIEDSANEPEPSNKLHDRLIRQGAELVLRETRAFSSETRPFGDTSRPSASLMFAPVRLGDRVVGFLSVQSYAHNAYSHADIGKLQTLADHCAGALERVRFDEAQRHERELLNALLNNSEDKIYFKDTESRFIRCSQTMAWLFGVQKPEDLIGKTDQDFFSGEHACEAFEDEQKIIRTGEPLVGKVEKETWPDSHVTWVLTTKMPLRDKAGEITGTFGISKDITAIKVAEAELNRERNMLSAIISNSMDNIYIKDTAGRKVMANPVEVKIMGYRTEAEALGKTDFDVFPHDLAAQYLADDQAVIQTGQPLVNREEKVVSPDGTVRWLLSSKIPFRDADGKIIGLVGMGRDVTAMKEAESKLNQFHRQLLETSRQAGMAEVATSVLHNVGNVLNSANVSTSLIADKMRNSKMANVAKVTALLQEHQQDLGDFLTNDPRGKQLPLYLAKLGEHLNEEREGMLHEIASLVNNIVHIKEIVAMQQSYAKASGVLESFKASDLVEDALRMNSAAVNRHHINVTQEFDDAPPILTDKHKVLQILVNLIRNAKYACDDSGRQDKQIILRIRADGGHLKISVIDNGIGIAAENLTRIFHHGFTTRKDGHGFGLHSGAIAAREMGGALIASSEGIGRGAAFTLELPLKPAQQHYEHQS